MSALEGSPPGISMTSTCRFKFMAMKWLGFVGGGRPPVPHPTQRHEAQQHDHNPDPYDGEQPAGGESPGGKYTRFERILVKASGSGMGMRSPRCVAVICIVKHWWA